MRRLKEWSDVMEQEEYLFTIDTEGTQMFAERLIGRRLTPSELYSVKKGLEWALTWDMDVVLETAIREALVS